MSKYSFSKALEEIKELKNVVSDINAEPSKLDGELKSLPYTFKDLIATSDLKTQASSKILDGFVPSYDATVYKKLKEAGASLVAKVHSDELGLGGTGQYSAYGAIGYPYDKKRIIGGSSSGSVASLTKNMAFSIATDTGDSVRLPASYNAFYGFKPSYGAISRYGLFAYASSLDTIGVLAHELDMVIKVTKNIYGKDKNDMTSKDVAKPTEQALKPKKVAFLRDGGILKKDVKDKYLELKDIISKDNIQVEEVEIDKKLLDAIDIVYSIISFSEASSNDSNLSGVGFGSRVKGKDWEDTITKTRSEKFGNMVQRRFTLGAYFLSNENQVEIFLKAQKVRRLIAESFNKIYDKYDLLIFPSADISPLKTESKPDNWHSSFLISANFTGNPSISIPWIEVNKLPVGLSFSSKIYSDKQLLSNVKYIETLLGGGHE